MQVRISRARLKTYAGPEWTCGGRGTPPPEREGNHVAKEIGDVLWMVAELCTSFDLDMDEVAEANIEKLKRRYPEGFTSENSIHRTE